MKSTNTLTMKGYFSLMRARTAWYALNCHMTFLFHDSRPQYTSTVNVTTEALYLNREGWRLIVVSWPSKTQPINLRMYYACKKILEFGVPRGVNDAYTDSFYGPYESTRHRL